MSTILAGLADLQAVAQAEADAVAANTAATQNVLKALVDDNTQIANLTAQLAALNSEDAAVQNLAAQFQATVTSQQANTAALVAAVTPPPAPAA